MKFILPILIAWVSIYGESHAKAPAREAPISVELKPAICMSPCDLTIEVVIPPQLDNRYASVEADGPMFRGSIIPLEGITAAKRHRIEYGGMTAGNYTVKVVLYDTTRETARVARTFIVKNNEN